MIRLVGVSPIEAYWIIEYVDNAKKEIGIYDFDLVVVRGEENLRKVLGRFWTPESSQFYALHIVMDKPTVIVRLDVPNRDLLESSIYHELAHAKLHGHRRFYEIGV
ncbi:MAG: hypothetical protein J7K87_01505, partial [Candidatus Aenigmarchaeota archaeon]|nr:hypothetical protein [Candidatus Aenigmarchaeota archaeon]